MTLEPIIVPIHDNAQIANLDSSRVHQKYATKNGEYVPGVTTVLGILNKPFLMKWYYDCGVKGIKPEDVRDAAATVGTAAHFMCECWLTLKNPRFIGYEQEVIDKASISFDKFKRFWQGEGFTLSSSEDQMVSETHKYGGTADIVAFDKQENYILIDIKTSKSIYDDYVLQLGAYKRLWNETKQVKINRQMIVKIGKEDPDDMDILELSNDLVDQATKKFDGALKTYKEDKIFKKMLLDVPYFNKWKKK